jgi:UDP-3-O-[3-hydroxymyristoyl] glucosamine N-acyltransferase
MNLAELARLIGGRLVGDGQIDITGAGTLDSAVPGQISYLAMSAYRRFVADTQASAVIVISEIDECPCAQIVCPDPYLGFAQAMRALYPATPSTGSIHPTAVIGKNCSIGPGVDIGAYCCIGDRVSIGSGCILHPHIVIHDDVSIGADCVIHSHVSIRERSVLGDRVVLQNGCRIGSDGYGFAKTPDGGHLKIPQMGRVVIGDDVEIGANCCIDRASLSETVIGRGTKLDNLVQVGHNVIVGEDCLLVAQVGLAGTATIGNRVTLAGQVGVSGHVSIGDDTTIGGKSGVTRDIPADEVYVGYPAIPYRQWKRLQRLAKEMLASKEFDQEDET